MPVLSCSWLFATLLIATSLSNQVQKVPDFSGTWVGISPGDTGIEQKVTQTPKTLEVSVGPTGGQALSVSTYNLDGSESRNERKSLGHAIVTLSRASWKGEQLTIMSATTFPDGTKSESVDVWSLDSKGNLVIEGTEKMMRADGAPDGTGKLHVVFRRKSG